MLKRILMLRKRCSDVVDLAKRNSRFLVPGTYLIRNSCAFCYPLLDNKFFDKHPGILKGLTIEPKWKSLLKNACANRMFILRDQESVDSYIKGSVISLTRSGEVKIVDLKNKVILTTDSASIMATNQQGQRTIHNYLPKVPELTHDCGPCYSLQPLVDKSATFLPDLNKLELIESVCVNLIDYAKDCKSNGVVEEICLSQILDTYSYKIKNALCREIKVLEYLINNIENIAEKLPVIDSHGDLSSSNLLIDDAGRWYTIDWAGVNRRSFWFDMFSLLLQTNVKDGGTLLNLYLNGGYDHKFYELFSAMGLEYSARLRVNYLAAYHIEEMFYFLESFNPFDAYELSSAIKYMKYSINRISRVCC